MTTTALVPMAEPSPTRSALALVPDAGKLAEAIAQTTFVPPAYQGKPGELLAAILTGDELGLPPMAAISKIHNIEGRASLSAEVMRAIVLSKGHDLWIEAASNQKVTLGGRRKGSTRDSFSTWTMEDAKKAGLDGRQNWRKYPKAMLLARATGELCRAIFADCLSGVSYTIEEIDDGILDEGEPVVDDLEAGERPADASPPPARTSTRTAKKAAKKAAAAKPKPAPAAAPLPDDPMAEFEALEALAQEKPSASFSEGRSRADARRAAEAELATAEGSPSLPPDRALAARARELGLDDETRHGLYVAITEGRASSGKDLTADEVRLVFDLFDRWSEVVVQESDGAWDVTLGDDEAAWFGVDAAVATAQQDPEPPPAEGLPDDWRAFIRDEGRRLAEVLKFAQATAADLGEEAPANVTALADASAELQHRVATFVRVGE